MTPHISLVLFDGDETLWHSATGDYVGRVPSSFRALNHTTIERIADHAIFTRAPGVPESFAYLARRNIIIGIVSDNTPEAVIESLRLFQLYDLIDPRAFSVRLWSGHCPKEIMIKEILERVSIEPRNVLLIDDKDYSDAMKSIGVAFHQKLQSEHMMDILRTWITGEGSE